MRKIFSILIVTVFIFSLTACTFQVKEETDESNSEFVEYGVAGNIVELEIGNDFESNRILVKGNSDNGATYTEGWVTITEDTKIYKNEIVTMNDLELNMYVNVFFDGPVAESFPVQGKAKQINIIEKDEVLETDSEE